MKSSRTAGVALRGEIRSLEDGAVGLMQQFGLNVVHPTPKAVGEWRQLIETKLYPALRGQGMPPDLFDEVQRLHREYIKTHGAKHG
jgi:hypothetical protein